MTETTDSPLKQILIDRIRSKGKITFRDWMAEVLYNEEFGYYTTKHKIWGRDGDYSTSPNRTPLFAATFARYFASLFVSLGSPAKFNIIEYGGGNGQFADVCLGVLRSRYPEVYEAVGYRFVEVGSSSNRIPGIRSSEFDDKVSFENNIVHSLCEDYPFIVFSNEFIDALPVHRVIMRAGVLNEVYVALDENLGFCWKEEDLSTTDLSNYFSSLNVSLVEGQVAEVNLEARNWLRKITESTQTGFVVTVDYGAEAAELYDPIIRPKGSLRAIRNHSIVDDLLADPGEQDITSTICWTDLMGFGNGLVMKNTTFERLDRFLVANGIFDELLVAQTENPAERLLLALGARDMILPNGMAQSFQVLVQEKLN